MKELLNKLYDNLIHKEKELKEREEKMYVDFITNVEKTCERLTKKYQEYKDILIAKDEYRKRVSFAVNDKTYAIYGIDNNGFVKVKLCYYHLTDYYGISLYNWEGSVNNRYFIKESIKSLGDIDWETKIEEKIEERIIKNLKFKVDKLVEKENELEKLEDKLRKGLE